MTKEQFEQQLNRVVTKIAVEYEPEQIILFGSRAWGTPTEDSDADLFIIKKSNKRRIDRARDVDGIIWGSEIPIDILVYTPEEVERRLYIEDPFIQQVLKKGKALFTKPTVYAS